mgnify:CR=1 FL=1
MRDKCGAGGLQPPNTNMACVGGLPAPLTNLVNLIIGIDRSVVILCGAVDMNILMLEIKVFG